LSNFLTFRSLKAKIYGYLLWKVMPTDRLRCLKLNRQERSEQIGTMIEIKNLSKFFSTENGDFVAINDINLTIEDGDIFGIIGMSGAGKSTLIRCINLLEKPSEGKILIDGQDITVLEGKDLLKLRRKIGMVFQRFNLLMQRTIRDNVAFPLEIAGVDKNNVWNGSTSF